MEIDLNGPFVLHDSVGVLFFCRLRFSWGF